MALPELAKELKNLAHREETAPDNPLGDRMTGAEAITLRRAALKNDPSIKDSTIPSFVASLPNNARTGQGG